MAKTDKYSILSHIQETRADIESRIIYLYEEINQESALKFVSAINHLRRTDGDINVHINSPGGSIDWGMSIYHAIKTCDRPIIGHVTGCAASMASVILQACDKRIMYPYTSIMIHPGGFGSEGHTPNVVAQAKDAEKSVNDIYTIYYERMKIAKDPKFSFEKFKKNFAIDSYIYPEKALELGLVDEIIKE